MPECPNCGQEFDSRRGLGVHHAQIHNELLPNRECVNCETRFHSEHEKKYCSESCREASVSFEGSDNPNYRGGRNSTNCEICGTTFEYYASEKPGRYCSSCVSNEQWRHRRDIYGERNPRWSGGEREFECDECGARFTRNRNDATAEHTFCSRDCQYAWISNAFTGDGHPNWKGGTDTNYGRGWWRARKATLERDAYQCVLCGVTKQELGRNPDVHHIVPVRAFVENPVTTERDAHYLENLVSLCIDCHRKAEFGHISRRRLQCLTTGEIS